jgi:D-inositol-3-phosphate glycosyltransferase
MSSSPQQLAMLCIHSSPLARLGGKEAGGMNVYVRALVRQLSQRGMLVDIFTRRHAPDLSATVPLEPGITLVHVPAGPPGPYDKNLILTHLPAIVDFITTFARQQGRRYALIHSHYWVSGEVALLLRERWRLPIVQMFHTLGALKNDVARSAEETETSQRIAIERRLLGAVDMTVAATVLDRQHMLQHYAADAGRIRVIPGGVDVQHFRPRPQAEARARLGLPPHARLLLAVGRMEPLKGFDNLLRALARLRHSQPQRYAHLRALLVGGEPETQPHAWNSEQRRLAALRDELGIADAVTFAGAQPHQRLPDYYAAADVFVMPSHYESFGLAALEAMACAVPVVASRVGGLAYTIENARSGLLVPPDQPPALAASLDRLLTDSALRERLQAGGLQRAAAYSWERVAAQLGQLYADVIQNASEKDTERNQA